MRRLLGKSPGYIARRAIEEGRQEARRLALARAAREDGPLSRQRIVPGGIERALSVTARSGPAMGAWLDGAGACAREPELSSAVSARADRAATGCVEVFGDEPVFAGSPPRWTTDIRSGFGWPRAFHRRIDYRNLGRASDVKVAWELSRLRHCVALAQAVTVHGREAELSLLDRDLVDWHASNPLGWSVNWANPMEVALRAVNLICLDAILSAADVRLPSRDLLVSSLYQHGWFLARHLEVADVNGNHFLADAVGLVWLGRYFAGVGESDDWLSTGSRMVSAAADEQVLPDGIDHEGSVPYHVLVLELFLAARAVAPDRLRHVDGVLGKMLEAAAALLGPHGRVPDLGDDDGGRALALSDVSSRDGRRVVALGAAVLDLPQPVALEKIHLEDAVWLLGADVLTGSGPASPPPPHRPAHFPDGGFAVLGGGGDHVVVDVGSVGFRGRGGHGHLDAMSFEATLDEILAVRDSGTGSYTGLPDLREELRDAAAHSVVLVDDLRYAQTGGPEALWLISGDSPPQVLAVGGDAAAQHLRARQQLPAKRGHALHERKIEWRPRELVVRDRILAPASSRVRCLLQVPAGCLATAGGFASEHHDYAVRMPERGTLSLEPCRCSSRYGSVAEALRASVEFTSRGDEEVVEWRITAL